MKKVLALCFVLVLLLACMPVSGVMAAGTPAEREDGDITIPIKPVNPPSPPQVDGNITTDLDDSGETDTDDAVYLLLHVMFGETDYPIPAGADCDFDGSGEVDTDDAVYLLLHVMFGETDYPLHPTNN